MNSPARESDEIWLVLVLPNNNIPMRMTRGIAMRWIAEFAEGKRYKHYQSATSVVVGECVIGMFVQELPSELAKLQEELLRHQVERERRERDLLGDNPDGD